MSEIHRRVGPESRHDSGSRGQSSADEMVATAMRSVREGQQRLHALQRLEIRNLSTEGRQQLGVLLTQQLRGQLPPVLAEALLQGKVPVKTLEALLASLNRGSTDPRAAAKTREFKDGAQSPKETSARALVGDAVPSSNHARSAAYAAQEGQRQVLAGGTGLRAPALNTAKKIGSPALSEREGLLRSLGPERSRALEALGIQSVEDLLDAGALPAGRARLAGQLGLSRAAMLALLYQLELLRIGPGQNGAQGPLPEHLGALRSAGVPSLAALAAVGELTEGARLRWLNRLKRYWSGSPLVGPRPHQRDVRHWLASGKRYASQIELREAPNVEGAFPEGDAEERVYAWYLERQWLEQQRRLQDLEMLRRDELERYEPDEEERTRWLEGLETEADAHREDGLVCFWITEPPRATRLDVAAVHRAYVCLDPRTGEIVPQQVSIEERHRL